MLIGLSNKACEKEKQLEQLSYSPWLVKEKESHSSSAFQNQDKFSSDYAGYLRLDAAHPRLKRPVKPWTEWAMFFSLLSEQRQASLPAVCAMIDEERTEI